jgi:hypothetical protein
MQQQQHQNGTQPGSAPHTCSALLRAITQSSSTDAQIRAIALEIRDWEELRHMSREHRVPPILFSRLVQAEAPLPPEAEHRLKSEYERNIFHCMANAAELIAILESFNKHGLPAMPFKGVVLAANVYGNANARTAGDLDLLVRARDLKRATDLLLERGYDLHTRVHADLSPVDSDCFECHFERRRDGMVTELRTRLELLGPRSDLDLGMDWVWPRRQSASLAGATVPDIDPEITLLMLCMHGSKHAWTRLSWIVDVARLLSARPDLNWNAIEREAKRTGLWRALALGVLLAHRVSDAPVPRPQLRRFTSVGAVRRLAEYIDANLFDPTLRKPPGFLPYAMRLLGVRDRLRLMLSLKIFRLSPQDRAFVNLPRPLHALYYLIRPLRLILDRSPR